MRQPEGRRAGQHGDGPETPPTDDLARLRADTSLRYVVHPARLAVTPARLAVTHRSVLLRQVELLRANRAVERPCRHDRSLAGAAPGCRGGHRKSVVLA